MKKAYITPTTQAVVLQARYSLLTTSPNDGMPTEDEDGNLHYGGPGGSFGDDEEIATKHRGGWSYDW